MSDDKKEIKDLEIFELCEVLAEKLHGEKEAIADIGENISIRRFARFEMGEGLEKKNEDFAEEVMKQMQK